MTQAKTLRQRMKDGEVLVALRGSIKTSKSELADIWSTGVYDYIWIDGQHTAYTEQQLVDYCGAAEELGIDVQLRIPHTRHAYLVGRFLDFGFSAVLVPEVMEPETVDDAIAYAYYGPIGRRSWGGTARRGAATYSAAATSAAATGPGASVGSGRFTNVLSSSMCTSTCSTCANMRWSRTSGVMSESYVSSSDRCAASNWPSRSNM